MTGSIEELFHVVADLTAEARAQYFAQRNIDGAIRREVETLVAFDSHSNTSLEQDISEVAQRTLARIEPNDTRCGPYRVGELLGRGGMGTVHLAERVDGEVAQRVAVKLLRPGADHPILRERFLAERQILATLSHPNIARLLDAGHREDGQPYLVMEYVEGQAIDVWASGLSLRHKITLFLKVCAAVGYLHRNLVVHRDLKPANILVTNEDEPKLLDFGIAKMLDLTNESHVTAMCMLTPDYASPEQVAGGPVTTATDIYSLGAVLYKLLTGASPHRFQGDSVEAITSAITSGRILPPGKLAPALRGDLEMILMKALRKEPQERYATIEQFSDDLQNYLESRPIRARKGDAWYQTRKFLRRYWLPVAATALAIAGLATGLTVANHQRAIAQRRFTDVRQLANKLFDIETEASKLSGSTKTRQLIVDTSLEYLRRLSADAQRDPELALEVGHAYIRVARVQGVPVVSNLGQLDQAEQNLLIAEQFIHSVLKTQPGNRTALLRSAQIAHDRMLLARSRSRDEEALALAGKSAEWLEKFHAEQSDESEWAVILAIYLNVADQHMYGRRFDDALRLCRRASDVARILNHENYYLATFHWVSAEVFRRRGELDESLREIRESVRDLDPGPENTDRGRIANFALALIREGNILGENNAINLGRPDEAVAALQRAFTIADTLVHQDPNDQSPRGRLAMAGNSMADILRHSDPRRALAIYDHTLQHMAEVKDNSGARRREVSALAGASHALRSLGRPVEAAQRLDAAFARLRQIKDFPAEKIKPGAEVGVALSAQADYEGGNGNLPKAIEIYQKLLGQMLTWGATPDRNLPDAVEFSRVYAALAELHRRAHQSDAATALDSRRLDLWRHWNARLPHNSFVRHQLDEANRSVTVQIIWPGLRKGGTA